VEYMETLVADLSAGQLATSERDVLLTLFSYRSGSRWSPRSPVTVCRGRSRCSPARITSQSHTS
jgi:hypothetical protein